MSAIEQPSAMVPEETTESKSPMQKRDGSSSGAIITPGITPVASAASNLAADESGGRLVSGFSFPKVNLDEVCDAFLEACKNNVLPEINRNLTLLRKAVLFHGIPNLNLASATEEDDVFDDETQDRLTLRGKLWKTFLGIDRVDAKEYIAMVQKTHSRKYDKIRSDSFRTFPDEKVFRDRVPEASIVRLLNSFVQRYPGLSYLQGMNAICAPLLFVMPEVDAYFTFNHLITKKFPLYWLNDVSGAEAGCKLVDEVLELIDPVLFKHLKQHSLPTAYVYGFSCVSSLSASVPPFEELIHLWDFLMAFGIHLNIVCVVAQVIMMRQKLLETDNPKAILDYRKWPPLRARAIVSITMSILPRLPPQLYTKICKHATDPAVASDIIGRKVVFDPDVAS